MLPALALSFIGTGQAEWPVRAAGLALLLGAGVAVAGAGSGAGGAGVAAIMAPQSAIQRSLRKATARRTAIVVAHRLSTVRHAHRIWVLDAGRVVEAGTHDGLVESDGAYAALWRVQTGDLVA